MTISKAGFSARRHAFRRCLLSVGNAFEIAVQKGAADSRGGRVAVSDASSSRRFAGSWSSRRAALPTSASCASSRSRPSRELLPPTLTPRLCDQPHRISSRRQPCPSAQSSRATSTSSASISFEAGPSDRRDALQDRHRYAGCAMRNQQGSARPAFSGARRRFARDSHGASPPNH